MKILTISGSARKEGANQKLLRSISKLLPEHQIDFFDIAALPLFVDQEVPISYPRRVLDWKSAIKEHDALIISTPEYIHNIPASLKNALEWIYHTGELFAKRILPIVYTPKAPRGQKAMQSLLNTLKALEATIIVEIQLHQTELQVVEGDLNGNPADLEMLKAAMQMLVQSD